MCPEVDGRNVSYYSFSLAFLGHAHLTDFNIATIIKDGERATALAGTKPYMGTSASPLSILSRHVFLYHLLTKQTQYLPPCNRSKWF